ncbi:Ku protein [Streptomyces sp. NPDC007189]|uniref:non-homologous end joining protein Ku n=1 Tax=Streptomyces sp. NPDC007189 TaxID=3154315 RepID=UPI003453BB4B
MLPRGLPSGRRGLQPPRRLHRCLRRRDRPAEGETWCRVTRSCFGAGPAGCRHACLSTCHTGQQCAHPQGQRPVTDEELSNLPLPTAKAIEIDAFVPLESIDPIRIAEGYYLQPAGQVAVKPYKLLVQALGRSSKVAVAKYAWSGRERLGLLRVRDDVLVLHAMRWPDEIRDPTELLPPPVEVSDEEIDSALALMDTMTVDKLEGPDFQDRYTEAIAQIIEAKREEKPLPSVPEPERPAAVLDLMAALQESVSKVKASRGEEPGPAEVHELPKKKTAAKKTPTRRPRTA